MKTKTYTTKDGYIITYPECIEINQVHVDSGCLIGENISGSVEIDFCVEGQKLSEIMNIAVSHKSFNLEEYKSNRKDEITCQCDLDDEIQHGGFIPRLVFIKFRERL